MSDLQRPKGVWPDPETDPPPWDEYVIYDDEEQSGEPDEGV